MTDEPATTPAEDPRDGSNWLSVIEARRERDASRALAQTMDAEVRWLTREFDEARAQAVQATTDADDLRARLTRLCDELLGTPLHLAADVHSYDVADRIRALIAPESTETGPVAAGSPETDPSATPDLLGPQIGAEQ